MSTIVNWPSSLPAPVVGRRQRVMPYLSVTVMESGRPRVRRTQEDIMETADFSWKLIGNQCALFRDFVSQDLNNGEYLFRMTTLEPAPDPSKLRQVVRVYGFLAPYRNINSEDGSLVSASIELDAEGNDAVITEIDNPLWIPPTERADFLVRLGPFYEYFILQDGARLQVRA